MLPKTTTSPSNLIKHLGPLTLILGGVLIIMILFCSSIGYISIPYSVTFKIILSKILQKQELLEGINKTYTYVVLDVRLPRVISAVLIGMGLSTAGVVFQGILLNPLADPYTLGISAGSAFGASIAIVFNILGASYCVPLFAFVGAILTLVVVILLSLSNGTISSNNLILSGVIITAILSAGISFMKFIADEHVSVIIFWLMGSLTSKSWNDVALAFSFVVSGFWICFFLAKDLNLLALGDTTAKSLGVNTTLIRIVLLVTASLITAICVSISGIIGFVGLIVPHLMRFITGADNIKLMPPSAIAGGILLLGADTITRTVLPTEIPIGVLTALIGGPIFCLIFKRKQKMTYHNG